MDEVSFDRGAMALRARRKKTLVRDHTVGSAKTLKPSAETARVMADGLIAAGIDKLPWSKPLKQWRGRVTFLRKAEGDTPAAFLVVDLSDDALAAQRETWLAPVLQDKTSLKELLGRRSVGCADDAAALGIARAARARSADAFRGADRHRSSRSTTRSSRARPLRVRLQELFGLNHPPFGWRKALVPLVLELLSPRIGRCR